MNSKISGLHHVTAIVNVRDNLVAVGYSNGADVAAARLLLRPKILPIAILFRAMVPLHPEKLPNFHLYAFGSALAIRIRPGRNT